MAKRIRKSARKFTQIAESRTHIQLNCDQLALGGQKLAYEFELEAKVNASDRKSTQVDGQTKRKLNASPKRASTCEPVWSGLSSITDFKIYL